MRSKARKLALVVSSDIPPERTFLLAGSWETITHTLTFDKICFYVTFNMANRFVRPETRRFTMDTILFTPLIPETTAFNFFA